jgi:hypothetical protein
MVVEIVQEGSLAIQEATATREKLAGPALQESPVSSRKWH